MSPATTFALFSRRPSPGDTNHHPLNSIFTTSAAKHMVIISFSLTETYFKRELLDFARSTTRFPKQASIPEVLKPPPPRCPATPTTQTTRTRPIGVLVLGQSRTGTSSMRVFHFFSLFEEPLQPADVAASFPRHVRGRPSPGPTARR